MNRRLMISIAVAAAVLGFAPATIRADDEGNKHLPPERLDVVDQLGYFTPNFKDAVRAYVFAKETMKDATAEQKKLSRDLPDLQKKVDEAQGRTVALRQELAKYEHPEENDFVLLQARMSDTSTKPEEQLALAQAYVWTYPASPHESDAQQYLQQVQKKLGDQVQAKKDAEAARAAAHAALVQRAQSKDLSLHEWRDFLRDMSEDDVVKLLGQPTLQKEDYWIYSGDWTADPTTGKKVGLQLNFNAGRVFSVDGKQNPP